MTCTRFQTDGMRLLDDELSAPERAEYEGHVRTCATCRAELQPLGRVVRMTDELRLRVPDESFWKGYWESVYRRSERRVGFLLLITGGVAAVVLGIVRWVTSPSFLTLPGVSATLIVAGLAVIFISVARERYHERRNDPYREVQR